MSVEKMEMMNLIGYIDDLDKVSMEVVRQGGVHVVNAFNEVSQNNFTVLTPEQNTSALMELNFIRPFVRNNDFSSVNEKLHELMDMLGVERFIKKKYVKSDFEFGDISRNIELIYQEVMGYYQELDSLKDELKKGQEFQEDIKHLQDVKLDFSNLKSLNFFNFSIGRLTKENYEKLDDNIENVSSIIYKICSIPGYQVILSLTPKVLESEVDRIYKSLNYEEIEIPFDLGGTPEEIVKKLEGLINELKNKIEIIEAKLSEIKDKYIVFLDESYSRMRLFEKVQAINGEVACTKDFFYMAGWVPVSKKESLQKGLAAFNDRLLLVFKSNSEVSSSITPPTKLKNNWLVRPFEALVRMYGTPSYDEMDPTAFVAISYMIMFGSMFGDLGQGFIFLISGILLSLKMRRPNLGGILSRIGISSMIFGILFGSVFGDEELLKPLLFHPLDNINSVLLGGVAIGILFTTVGFIFSLLNALKRRDLEDGVFGKDGLVGLLFYWITLLTALEVYKQGDTKVPIVPIIMVLCILLALMVLKEPLANLLSGHRPLYHEPLQDYYIESGFGVIETLLSMLSNTISFIRVGAFALNHVGLFVAFATIAHMMKNSTGSTAVMIVGNIVIIGLEGLIVFIQGLRLEYYELFSKYYKGEGLEYEPVRLEYSRRFLDANIDRSMKFESRQSVEV